MTLLRSIYLFVFMISSPVFSHITPINKVIETIRLTRPQNIPATLALSVAGSHIMNPLSPKSYILPCIESILVMSNSMVLNDIWDIEADRINTPERPLVKGIVKKREAIVFSLVLTGITEIINIVYLPRHIHWIIHSALLYIHLYTPILKRIPLIKNISCALLVSFSLIFSGLSSSISVPFLENPNRGILYIVANSIFGGSLTNEILLDIRDEKGDRMNHIWTLATLYGKQTAWTIAYTILYVNILMNMIGLIRIGVNPILYIVIMGPQFYMLQKIMDSKFSKKSIQSYLNHTTRTMMVILFILSYSKTN